MVAFEVFRALGVEVFVRPVVEHISKFLDMEDMDDMFHTHSHIGQKLSEPVNTYAEWGNGTDLPEVYDEYPNDLVEVIWLNEPTVGTQNIQFGFMRVSMEHMRLWT
jgi:hypothetical protein